MLTAFGLHSIQLELWNILFLVEQQPEEPRPCWSPPRVCFLTHTHPETHERAEGSARQCGLDSVESLQDEEKESEVPHLDSAPSHALWLTLPAAFPISSPPYNRNQEDSDNEQRWLFVIYSVSSLSPGPQHNQEGLSQKAKRNRGKSKISEVATYGSRYKRRVSSHNLCKKKKKKSCIRIYSCGRRRNRGWAGRGIIKKDEFLGLFLIQNFIEGQK